MQGVFAIFTSGAIAVMFYVLGVYWFRLQQVCHLRTMLNELHEQAKFFSNRWPILSDNAADYILSLGSTGSQELNDIRHILTAVTHLINETECLLLSGDDVSLATAQSLLEYRYDSIIWSFRKDDKATFPDAQWERRCETLFQSVGRRLVAAAISANDIHVPKMHKALIYAFGTQQHKDRSSYGATAIAKGIGSFHFNDIKAKVVTLMWVRRVRSVIDNGVGLIYTEVL